MSHHVVTRRVRPYLFTSFKRLQYQSNTGCAFSSRTALYTKTPPEKEVTKDYERRVAQLEAIVPAAQWYPKLQHSLDEHTSTTVFRRKYEHLKPDETDEDNVVVFAGIWQILDPMQCECHAERFQAESNPSAMLAPNSCSWTSNKATVPFKPSSN